MAEQPAIRTSVGTVDDLLDSAIRRTGLSDFGDDSDGFRDALAVLLDSYERDEDLTPAGSKMARVFLRDALVARLVSQAAFAAHPEHADVPIERPLFVTGLPRTGTTALHRLLSADPANQGLEMWLTQMPQPRPPRDTWAANPVFAAIETGFAQHHVEHPEFMGVHYMSAAEVEECWQLLRQSVHSVSYECLAHLPTYSSWLAERDWTPAYARHRRNLQLIGSADRDRRWVLKNPSHLFALDALTTVYPDALVVVTHRPAATAMASACSLAAHATDGWSRRFVGDTIGRDQLDLWSRGLETFTAARARCDESRFVDVDYRDFVADPIGTVGGIYDRFGLPLTADAESAMVALHSASRSGDRAPAHRYSAADFGLSDAEIAERFPTGA